MSIQIRDAIDDAADRDAKLAAGNILSGNNGCGTLAMAVENGESDYFVAAIKPILAVRHAELVQAREDAISRAERITALERVLEFVAQNIGGSVSIKEPVIIAEISKVLGRRI